MQSLWKVAQSPNNCPIWSHCSESKEKPQARKDLHTLWNVRKVDSQITVFHSANDLVFHFKRGSTQLKLLKPRRLKHYVGVLLNGCQRYWFTQLLIYTFIFVRRSINRCVWERGGGQCRYVRTCAAKSVDCLVFLREREREKESQGKTNKKFRLTLKNCRISKRIFGRNFIEGAFRILSACHFLKNWRFPASSSLFFTFLYNYL